MHIERGKQRLCFDMAVAGGAFQPSDTFRLAAWYARRFKIAASDPVLRLRQSGLRGADVQGERLGMFAFRREAGSPAHGGCRGQQGVNPIQRPHYNFIPKPV